MSPFGSDALRRLRQEQELKKTGPPEQENLLAGIPPDVDTDDTTITVWDGRRFVDYEKWKLERPVRKSEEEQP